MLDSNYKAFFSSFPKEEYIERCRKAQRKMVLNDIDALILTQKENVEYFSGYYTTHWAVKGMPNGIVLIFPEDMPTLVVPDFLAGTAERTSWLEDIISHPKTHMYPRDLIKLVINVLKSKRLLKSKKIGIEKGREIKINLSKEDHDLLMEGLSDSVVVSGEDVIWGARSIKTKREIDCIKKSVSITVKAYKKLKDSFLKANISEIDIANFVKIKMIENGADNNTFINFRAGKERYPMADTYPQERTLRKGDMLVLDGGALYKGYWSDICRVAHVGKATKEHREMYQIAIDAQKAAIDAVKPGVRAGDIYDIVRQILKKAKKGDKLSMCGHALGLDLHEPPILSPNCDDILKEGMVITIEPWIYDPQGLGVFAVEDDIVVTADGCKNITNLDKEQLWIV